MEFWLTLIGWALIIVAIAAGPLLAISALGATAAGAGSLVTGAVRGDKRAITAGLSILGALGLLLFLNLRYYGVIPPRPLPPPPAAPAQPGPREAIYDDWDRLQAARMAASGHFTAVYSLQHGPTEANGEELIATSTFGRSRIVEEWQANRIEIVQAPECLAPLRGPPRGPSSLPSAGFWERCVREIPAGWTGTGPPQPMTLIRSQRGGRGMGTYEIWRKEGDRITLVRRCGEVTRIDGGGVGRMVTGFVNVGSWFAAARAQKEYLQCLWATKDQLNAGTL